MAQPVWVLSVDLQTKTATFQTGLAEAAKTARASFNDIKTGADGMGSAVGSSMTASRHSVMLLTEEFGVHLPRALTSFIAGLGPIGPALNAAFPFLAIAVGATLLIEHLEKLHQAGEKLTEDQLKLGTAVADAFNALDVKILQAQKRIDELKKDHLGALKIELELIDKQSMAELVQSFEMVAKASDAVLKELEGHWYALGKGSEGATHALDDFQAHYALLLKTGKEEAASGLLHGTLDQAKTVLTLLQARVVKPTGDAAKDAASYNAAVEAHKKLDALGISTGANLDKQVESQQALVDALNAQLGIEQRISELKKLEGTGARLQAAKEDTKDDKEAARKMAEAQKAGAEDYVRALVASGKEAVDAVQQAEREEIEATDSGSKARLQVVEDAITKEQQMGLQDTDFYKSLLNERVQLTRQVAEEDARTEAEAAQESAAHDAAMGSLAVAALRQHMQLMASVRRQSEAERLADEERTSSAEYAVKWVELSREIEALDKSGKDYENKLKALQDKEKQLTQQHEDDLTAIKEKAEQERNTRILSADAQFNDTIARGLTQSIMGHQTWAKMVVSFGQEVVGGMIENAIKSMLAADMTKERDAAAAARKAFNIGMSIGGPAGVILGPVMGAAAFAQVMAFSSGTDEVPGVGRGDMVPAMLEPGEGVVPGGVMDGLSKIAREGGFNQGQHIHATAHFAPQIHALDADGVDRVLEKHQDTFQRHFENTLRKMNR
jgi:hypothetical protein